MDGPRVFTGHDTPEPTHPHHTRVFCEAKSENNRANTKSLSETALSQFKFKRCHCISNYLHTWTFTQERTDTTWPGVAGYCSAHLLLVGVDERRQSILVEQECRRHCRQGWSPAIGRSLSQRLPPLLSSELDIESVHLVLEKSNVFVPSLSSHRTPGTLSLRRRKSAQKKIAGSVVKCAQPR